MEGNYDISTQQGRAAALELLKTLGGPEGNTDTVAAAVAVMGPSMLIPGNCEDLDELCEQASQDERSQRGAQLVLNCLACVGTGVRREPTVVLGVRGVFVPQRHHQVRVLSSVHGLRLWLAKHLQLLESSIVVHPRLLDPWELRRRPSELLLEVQTVTSLHYMPESIAEDARPGEMPQNGSTCILLIKISATAFDERIDRIMDHPAARAPQPLKLPYFLADGRQGFAQFTPDFVGLPWRACLPE